MLLISEWTDALGLLIKHPMLYLFGASDETYPYADRYLSIYLLGSIFVMTGLGMNSFINSQGFGKTGMMTVILGAVANLILDPIFIFVLNMGVQGAALATVISQGLSAAWILRFLTGPQTILKLRMSCMQLEKKRVKNIVALGLSGFTMSVTNGLVQIFCNATLQSFGGDLFVGIMTVINSVREIVQLPVQGLTNSGQPVMGYNYGAGEYGRVKKAIIFISISTILYTALMWMIINTFPGFFIRIFNHDADLLDNGIHAMRVLLFSASCSCPCSLRGQSIIRGAWARQKNAVFFSIFPQGSLSWCR